MIGKMPLASTGLALLAALALKTGPGRAGDEVQSDSSQPECRILTTIYPLQIMALNVTRGVPGVRVANMAAPAAGCLHHYQLTPNDLKALAHAGILIANGAGMESFLDEALKLVPRERVIVATEGIDLLRDGDEPNPHVWVSPSGAIQQVRTIAEGLAKLDPTRAEAYRRNAEAYIGKLEELRERMRTGLAGAGGRPIVTFHEAFPYFAREFGLTVATVVSQHHGAAPSPRDLVKTIAAIRKAGAVAIFTEPQYPSDVAKTIAEETGAKVYTLDPAVTGPVSENAYLEIMESNLRTLQEALK
jgi:zinc transport system substrate-binding protein